MHLQLPVIPTSTPYLHINLKSEILESGLSIPVFPETAFKSFTFKINVQIGG